MSHARARPMKIVLRIRGIAVPGGIPIIVDDNGEPMGQAEGLRALMKETGFSIGQLAAITGVSDRTVEGWLQGRSIHAQSLIALMLALEDRK